MTSMVAVEPLIRYTPFLPFHQYNMISLNLLMERLGHIVPDEEIHPERQAAFLERFPEIGNPAVLLRRCEYHQVEVGLRT